MEYKLIVENWKKYSDHQNYLDEFDVKIDHINNKRLQESNFNNFLSFVKKGIQKALNSTAQMGARLLRKMSALVEKIKSSPVLYNGIKILLGLALFSLLMSPSTAFAAVEFEGATIGPGAAETSELYTNGIRGSLEILASALENIASSDLSHEARTKFHEILSLISKINKVEVVEITKAEKIYLIYAESILDLIRETEQATGFKGNMARMLLDMGENIKDFAVNDFQKFRDTYNMKYSGELPGQSSNDLVKSVGTTFANNIVK